MKSNMKSIFNNTNYGEFVLAIVLIIYLLAGYSTPKPFSEVFNSLIGKIVMFLVVISLFLHSSPILATLVLFVCFELMRRSSSYNSQYDLFGEKQLFNPISQYPIQSQQTSGHFSKHNQFPFTLEQEIVKKMVPLTNPGNSSNKPSYKPLLEDFYGASPLNEMD
jgi:hypothetical protein